MTAEPPESPKRPVVAITGASGFIGTALRKRFEPRGHRILRLVRRRARSPDEVSWDPRRGKIDHTGLEGVDAAVHLAGEPIDQRWTAARKRRILESRANGTRLFADTLASLKQPPRVLLSASAVGFYGDRGDEILTERSREGTGFLADVCQAWEEGTGTAEEAGIRVVHTRNGLVMGRRGGALKKMLPPFKFGLGGVVGSGRQWWSWISIDDHVAALEFLLEAKLQGPVNLVGPAPATSREFVKALGRVLNRPTLIPMPSPAVKVAFGQMGEEVLLYSQRVVPSKLLSAGFQFHHGLLEPALRHAVNSRRDGAG